MLGWAAVQEVDWSRLFHAYGVADDTPDQLRNLTSDDPRLRRTALAHLDSAVLHQGTIYSVTPVAVQVVAGMLREPILRAPLDDGTNTLARVLAFLAAVGSSAGEAKLAEPVPQPSDEELTELFHHLRHEDDKGWGSDLIEVLMKQAMFALREIADEVQAVILPFVSDPAADVRRLALDGISQWGALQPGSAQTATSAKLVTDGLERCEGRDERAGLLLSLGKIGCDVSAWLDDPDEAVRACAAIFVRSERATAVLVSALTHPAEVNAWFDNRPAFFRFHVRFLLLGEAIARGVTIEQMLPAALAMIAASSAMTADAEWGRILQLAFPDQAAAFKPGIRPPLPPRLTGAQRAVLEALVANQNLWDPRNGNASLARMRVGLPNARDEVAAYCRNAPAV